MASEAGAIHASARMLPREHGAWGMLAVSFHCGLALAGGVAWTSVAAAAAVLLLFLIREPLVVLGRQAMVWREPRPEAAVARRVAWRRFVLLGAAGALLLLDVPLLYLLPLGVFACGTLALGVWMAVRNRQRSIWVQALSAAGLNASSVVAWLSVRHEPACEVWWLWAMLTVHSIASVLIVHARLEAKIHARGLPQAAPLPFLEGARRAGVFQLVVIGSAAAAALAGRPLVSAALVLSAAAHLADIARLRRRASLDTPLKRIGWRAVGLSAAFAAILLAGLR